MDTEKFDMFVADNLPMPPQLATPRQIDDAVDHLINIVQRGVHESTPWARPSPLANPSWTKECGEAVKHSRRMFRQYLATHSEEDWETYKLARNQSIRQSTQLPKGLQRSIHAPVTRSEPPRRRAPSRASTSSSATTRSKGLLRSVLDAGEPQKRARDDVYVYEDKEVEILDTPSSSAPAASASEYQPSVLSRSSGNRRASTGKYRAAGKENTIFKANTKGATVHTPGPRGKNKRTLDDQVNLTMSAPSVKFTSRTDMQEERRTRQFTKKHTETPSNE